LARSSQVLDAATGRRRRIVTHLAGAKIVLAGQMRHTRDTSCC
jgi:hypothetical protein